MSKGNERYSPSPLAGLFSLTRKSSRMMVGKRREGNNKFIFRKINVVRFW